MRNADKEKEGGVRGSGGMGLGSKGRIREGGRGQLVRRAGMKNSLQKSHVE